MGLFAIIAPDCLGGWNGFSFLVPIVHAIVYAAFRGEACSAQSRSLARRLRRRTGLQVAAPAEWSMLKSYPIFRFVDLESQCTLIVIQPCSLPYRSCF